MKRNLTVIEPHPGPHAYEGPCQEIAIHIRNLLACEYAFVTVRDAESIQIQGFVGPDGDIAPNLASNLLSRIRDCGPVIVDDARLVAVPASAGGQVLGLLIGYSSRPGAFTSQDLDKLVAYAPVASAIIANLAAESRADNGATVTTDELLHFFRLITIGELSACFAHEVKNPLTLIRGHIRLMDEEMPADHPLRKHVEAINRASSRIDEMARRMLDFSKKRARRTELCKIDELISDALRFVQPYVRTKFIDVQLRVDPLLPAINADRWPMVQAIVNTLQNAADAMMEVDRRVLTITADKVENEVRIIIADSGTGIAPLNIQRIFEPFFTTKGDKGTGLGLYITKQVVEDHHGNVTVQTGNGHTSFTISLPL
jgi:signal transduction histidine kinase